MDPVPSGNQSKERLSLSLESLPPGFCACGCGRPTKFVAGNYLKYVNGTHHPNRKLPQRPLCACGCGQPAKFVAGKYLKYAGAPHHPNYKEFKPEPSRLQPKSPPPQPLRSLIPKTPPIPKRLPQSNIEEGTQDRLGPLVRRMQADPKFVTDARRWLGAEQAASDRKYMAKRLKEDLGFRLLSNLRGRIRAALKGKGKSKRTMHLVGCSIPELKAHLEKQFTPGMSWSNYGRWHVDHIIPCCAFDLSSHEQQRSCFHFSNLQPLWAADNFKKSGKHCRDG